jgi:hypothetical protein
LADDSTSQKRAQLYVPDFSLRVDDRCVYLKIDRDLWRNGVIKSNYERINNHLSDSIEYIPAATTGNEDQPTTTGSHPNIIMPLSSNNELNSATNSPHHQVLLKKFKETTSGLQVPPNSSSVGKLDVGQGGRRSTITVNVLSKAQDMMAKSFTKLSHSRLALNENSKLTESMKEVNNEEAAAAANDDENDRTGLIMNTSDSGGGGGERSTSKGRFLIVNSDTSVNNQNEAGCGSDGESLALPDSARHAADEEKEPLMNRSTFSLNLLGPKDKKHESEEGENVSMDEKYNPTSQL